MKKCDLCNKQSFFGRNIRHKASGSWARKATRTSKTQLPNLRNLKMLNENGTPVVIKVCMSCYKAINLNQKA